MQKQTQLELELVMPSSLSMSITTTLRTHPTKHVRYNKVIQGIIYTQRHQINKVQGRTQRNSSISNYRKFKDSCMTIMKLEFFI